MLYLYRLDLIPLSGLLSDPQSALAGYQTNARQSFCITNWEEPVILPASSPLTSAFLPADAMAGLRTYVPTAGVQHSGITLNSERASGELTLTLPRSHAVSQLWANGSPQFQVWITVALLEVPTSAATVVWSGRVRGAEFDELLCKLSCMHLADLVQRQGLVRKHSRACPHTLYDPATCGVKPNATLAEGDFVYYRYREDGFLATVAADGMSVVVPEAANRPDGFFGNDGMLIVAGTYEAGHAPRANPVAQPTSYQTNTVHGGIARSIVGHVGATLTLALPLPASLSPGAQLTLYRGCKKVESDCSTAFGNFEIGYGGYPYIPIKNVFQTGLK